MWNRLEERLIKVNCGWAFESNSRIVGIGVIARNSDGVIMNGINRKKMTANAFMAKAMDFKDGVKLAIEEKWQRVILEIDSKEL